MTLDIRGSLKNTKVSSDGYVIFEELISNSIDAFLIRQHADPQARSLLVLIEVDVTSSGLLADGTDILITCTDNGCGFGDDQTDAFVTKDTSYKDDLAIPGIAKCKGSGRIQYFHHFERVGVRSTFRSGSEVTTRTLVPDAGRRKIDVADFSRSIGDEREIGTTIRLEGLRPATRARLYKTESLADVFSAANLRRNMLIAFLQRLVSLKSQLGEFEITFETRYPKGGVDRSSLSAADLPEVTIIRSTDVAERDPRSGAPLGTVQTFTLSHYRLDAQTYDLPRNAISFCARSSPVLDITRRYLKTFAEQNRPVEGFHHIVLIEADLLDRRVNEQRDGFYEIPGEIPVDDLFTDATVAYADIYDRIDPIVAEMVTPSG